MFVLRRGVNARYLEPLAPVTEQTAGGGVMKSEAVFVAAC